MRKASQQGGGARPTITNISFRDKTNGWKLYGVKFGYQANYEITPFNREPYMRGFLKDLYLRPSCHDCAARQGKSGADITIADYWGIQITHPEFDDNKGVSAVLINTGKGLTAYKTILSQTESIASDYERIIQHNPCVVVSKPEPRQRDEFWQRFNKVGISAISEILPSSKYDKLLRSIKRFMQRITQQN